MKGFLPALRKVVCAAAGCVGTERGDRGDSSKQPVEWCSNPGRAVLGLPLAGPAGNSGSNDLNANSYNDRTGQVKPSKSMYEHCKLA